MVPPFPVDGDLLPPLLSGVHTSASTSASDVTVRTLFFAAYRDLLGVRSLDVDLAADATVEDLVRTLRDRGGPFSALPADPPVAVNRAYAGPEASLSDGDEVAFLPPVAGG